MVLFAEVKKNLDMKQIESEMQLTDEQTKELREDLKQDSWAPIAVWHPQPVDRNQQVTPLEVLDNAIKYAKALFAINP